LYCRTDASIVCQLCFDSHSGHAVVSISTAAKDRLDKEQQHEKELRDMVVRLRTTAKKLAERCAVVTASTAESVGLIHANVDELVMALRKREKALCEEVLRETQMQTTELRERQQRVEEAIARIEAAVGTITANKSRNDDATYILDPDAALAGPEGDANVTKRRRRVCCSRRGRPTRRRDGRAGRAGGSGDLRACAGWWSQHQLHYCYHNAATT
jgi:hypothetical protein